MREFIQLHKKQNLFSKYFQFHLTYIDYTYLRLTHLIEFFHNFHASSVRLT